MAKLLATIQKVRYLTYPKYRTEVQYTVEGSDKVYKHTMSHSFKLSNWRKEEIHQLSKSFWGEMKSFGDGSRAKILYDSTRSFKTLQFEIDTSCKLLCLRRVRR